MGNSWTFGQKLAAGFGSLVVLSIASSALAYYAIQHISDSKDRVIDVNDHDIAEAQKMRMETERELSALRGYLLTRDEALSTELDSAHEHIAKMADALHNDVATEAEKQLVREIREKETVFNKKLKEHVAKRKAESTADTAAVNLDKELLDKKEDVARSVEAFITREMSAIDDAKKDSKRETSLMEMIVVIVAIVTTLVAIGIAVGLTRSLTSQIGGAVQHIQSASTELQAAANQQATCSKEQATSMSEISTTISELLATSRQIAESAQRVTQIAQETSGAARAGDQTVQRSLEMTAAIRRQVDQIVGHMLDLGKKSQQIGSILEIIDELAEQTNILSINATIEAAGAGESGKRFSVVADEIRKLADRVGTSSKEIRGLIDEIRAAVNTSVMATETGSKAVDAGGRQFNEVAVSLKQIGGLVGTTTEAAREIELSTKQQTTAVEQVNVAISNVAQATKESETSARQTLQTAGILTNLSGDLNKLVRRAS